MMSVSQKEDWEWTTNNMSRKQISRDGRTTGCHFLEQVFWTRQWESWSWRWRMYLPKQNPFYISWSVERHCCCFPLRLRSVSGTWSDTIAIHGISKQQAWRGVPRIMWCDGWKPVMWHNSCFQNWLQSGWVDRAITLLIRLRKYRTIRCRHGEVLFVRRGLQIL